jgi:putative ABC transport system ATP-binding protein
LHSAEAILNSSTEAIVAQNVTKYFGEGDARMTAVDHVNFVAHFGEMVFIVGPSGSGKTTFLSMISGILRPNEGQVLLHGEDLWQKSNDSLAELRLHKIGFVFQDFHLFPRLTTAENVAIPLILRGEDWDASIATSRKMLEVVNLAQRADVLPVKLSGGEQQRVAIARAMVGEPDILVFDEPTASLDGDTGKMIIAFVKQQILNPKRCILIVTHDARINEFADRIVHMENGRITAFDKGTE